MKAAWRWLPLSDLHARQGFTVELWVRFDTVSENMNVIAKDGEYMVRVDPPAEGGNISFFVDVGGSLEPRVRGPKAEPGKWHHVIAAWDGDYALLWVNGREYRKRRIGGVVPSEGPVLVGRPCKWGPVGLKGTIDEVKLYDRALSSGQVLVAEYGLSDARPATRARAPRFEFAGDEEGWEGRGVRGLSVRDGSLGFETMDHGSAVLQRGLDAPLEGLSYLSLRMSSSAGDEGRIVFATTRGAGALTFPVKADGRMHSYVLRAEDDPAWEGRLRSLALVPSTSASRVEVDLLRVSREPDAPAELEVVSFLPDRVINRAGQERPIVAELRNAGGEGRDVQAVLETPDGVSVEGDASQVVRRIAHGETVRLTWQVRASTAKEATLALRVTCPPGAAALATVKVDFAPAAPVADTGYVPAPEPAESDLLVGAHYCPLWKQGSRSTGWELIEPYAKRKPALGWYDEDDPEVTDWEIKWALEHGISFFVYCWYRKSQGGPVEMSLPHAIHDGLFKAKYGSQFKFCIMWENQSKGHAGVASEEDLLENLLPFWIETYFKHPSYLKVDNKPLLFIYRPEYLVNDLGSVAAVRSALDKMRQACREAGFDGLTLLGEYRGVHPKPLELMAEEGLDYTFAYCWPVGGNPEAEAAIEAQESSWRKHAEQGIIPEVLTVSMGWDSRPWHPSSTIWRLPPKDFRTLCERARDFMAQMPEESLGRRVLLLDNWNEFGEGHYIAPHREYGFGYLDAVRSALTRAPEPHVDLVPEDVGRGPYEKGYTAYKERLATCRQRVVAKEGVAPGLAGWWTFDEPASSGFALDYSGNRRGGFFDRATQAKGVRGSALLCDGGSLVIPVGEKPLPSRQMTITCWIKATAEGQQDRWFVNNIFGGGMAGFRFGLSGGRLCWAIPREAWSHHLVADAPVPVGRWVHTAAVYDGDMMRLYMDGKEVGAMRRGGRIRTSRYSLCLGNFGVNHRAHFVGLLDEVRMYSRALSAEEIGEASAEFRMMNDE